jgi:hypothetical protein
MSDLRQDGEAGETQSFFGRHKRWLTFIGALIVFLTFIYNEGVREELKDRSDTLNTAENLFVMRSDTNQLSVYMAYINSRLGQATPVPRRTGGNTGFSLQRMRETVDLMLAYVNRLEAADENLTRVAEALGPDSKNDARLSTIKLVVQAAKEQNDIVRRKANEENSASTHDPQNIGKIMDKANEVGKQCNDLRHDQIEPLENTMLAEANSQRKASEEKYSASKKVGYCLFAFGWLLGLIGKLSGAGSIAGDD